MYKKVSKYGVLFVLFAVIISVFLATTASAQSCEPLPLDAVTYLGFGEGEGTATVEDINFVSALVAFAGWVPGQVGNGLDFDGVNSVVLLEDSDELSFGNSVNDEPFSVSAWVFFDDELTKQRIVGKADAPDDGEWLLTTNGQDTLAFYLFDPSSGYNFIGRTGDVPPVGTWMHVTATYDGSSSAEGIKLYVNGARVADSPVSMGTYVAMDNTGKDLTVGRYGDTHLDGKVDEVLIFNKELTDMEVLNVFNNGMMSAGYCPESCVEDSDCVEGLCVNEFCRDVCNMDSQCESGEVCMEKKCMSETEAEIVKDEIISSTTEMVEQTAHSSFALLTHDVLKTKEFCQGIKSTEEVVEMYYDYSTDLLELSNMVDAPDSVTLESDNCDLDYVTFKLPSEENATPIEAIRLTNTGTEYALYFINILGDIFSGKLAPGEITEISQSKSASKIDVMISSVDGTTVNAETVTDDSLDVSYGSGYCFMNWGPKCTGDENCPEPGDSAQCMFCEPVDWYQIITDWEIMIYVDPVTLKKTMRHMANVKNYFNGCTCLPQPVWPLPKDGWKVMYEQPWI